MLISVIIPVKNGDQTLGDCLASIKEQTIAENIEIIILDSYSNDKSLEIAQQFNAKIINIPSGSFNHGLTRNEGIKYASGQLLYFTVQDARLAERNQLEKMAAHFEDKEIMAITGAQAVPHDLNKNPALWFIRYSKPQTVFKHLSPGTYRQLSFQKQFEMTSEWDDVNAMYRRQALEQIPFTETDFAEDKLWAKDALIAGMKIGFDPSLLVYHYHHSTFVYTFKLEFTVNYHYFLYFNVYPRWPAFFKPALSSIYQVWKKSELKMMAKIYWSFHNFFRILGYAVSNIAFLVFGKFFGKNALEKSYNFFCKKIPQGTVK